MVLGKPRSRYNHALPLILYLFNQADYMFDVEDEVQSVATALLVFRIVRC